MGAFWDAIQAELDKERFEVSDRKLALRLGVSPSTIGNWRRGMKHLPSENSLREVASFTGRPYQDVLLLALSETGYARGTDLADSAPNARAGDAGDDNVIEHDFGIEGPTPPVDAAADDPGTESKGAYIRRRQDEDAERCDE